MIFFLFITWIQRQSKLQISFVIKMKACLLFWLKQNYGILWTRFFTLKIKNSVLIVFWFPLVQRMEKMKIKVLCWLILEKEVLNMIKKLIRKFFSVNQEMENLDHKSGKFLFGLQMLNELWMISKKPSRKFFKVIQVNFKVRKKFPLH